MVTQASLHNVAVHNDYGRPYFFIQSRPAFIAVPLSRSPVVITDDSRAETLFTLSQVLSEQNDVRDIRRGNRRDTVRHGDRSFMGIAPAAVHRSTSTSSPRRRHFGGLGRARRRAADERAFGMNPVSLHREGGPQWNLS